MSAGVDKTLLATKVERMDTKVEFSKKVEQQERQFQSWRCGVSTVSQYVTRPMIIWMYHRNVYWIRWLCSCCKCSSWM